MLEPNLECLDSVRTMQKLVHNPTEVFLALMQKLVKKMTIEFIANTGVDVAVIKKCINKNILLLYSTRSVQFIKEFFFMIINKHKARMTRTLIWAIMSSLLYLLSYSLKVCGQRICTSIYWSWARYVTITLIRVYKEQGFINKKIF